MDEQPLVYMAGPLFDEGERWWIETMDVLVANAGFRTFLPHRDNPPKTADNAPDIYENDKRAPDGEKVNLMIENSLDVLVDSLETLQHALGQWKVANP